MADSALGTKQICPNCLAKFYDLTKRPAHCPKCAHEFDPEEALRTRRTRGRPASSDDYISDDEAEDQVKGQTAEDEDEEPEVTAPEIDEVVVDDTLIVDEDDDLDPADPARVTPDTVDMDIDDALIVDDDDGDDVPFLEDDEDDFDEEIDGLTPKDDDDI